MPRLLRLEYENAWHHVMNRGACRQNTFLDPDDRQRFLDLLGDSTERAGVEVHGYCLMNNHYHLLVRTPTPALGRTMQLLAGRYTRYFNHRHSRDGALFRGRYRSKAVESDGQLLATLRYIHRNPTNDFEVHPDDYLWSSQRPYRELVAPSPWLHTKELLSIAGGADGFASLIYSPLGDEASAATLPDGWVAA
ncbi:MAG: hypothetical protein HKN26_09350 [Acidimicrobiales bacterium]|nr:hypothetical protein [Acidimicrobiales bacterium]